jgi:hypothetical protein
MGNAWLLTYPDLLALRLKMISFWVSCLPAATSFSLLLFVPIVVQFDGARLDCGTAVRKFLPVDPVGLREGSREYREFWACRAAGFSNGAVPLALIVLVPISFAVHERRYRARRSEGVPPRPDL